LTFLDELALRVYPKDYIVLTHQQVLQLGKTSFLNDSPASPSHHERINAGRKVMAKLTTLKQSPFRACDASDVRTRAEGKKTDRQTQPSDDSGEPLALCVSVCGCD
jgi:hypothetical protein